MFRTGRARQAPAMGISSLLTHCAGCESALIQIAPLGAPSPESALIARECPECGHADELELPPAVAELLLQRSGDFSLALLELADRLELADELWVYDPL
jgi:hypothetical protein